MDEYLIAVEQAGFRGFSDYPHLHVSLGARQIGVMRLGDDGKFQWGWVEVENGRSDFWEWAAWWKALRKVKAA
jgi:hypothetical protein